MLIVLLCNSLSVVVQAIEAFNIKPLAKKFDDDIEDDNLQHMSTISVVGVAHTLVWQFFSHTVVLSKLGEAVNEQGHSPFIVARNSNITVMDKWSGNSVRMTPTGDVQEEKDEASGVIVAILQRQELPVQDHDSDEKQEDEENQDDVRLTLHSDLARQ